MRGFLTSLNAEMFRLRRARGLYWILGATVLLVFAQVVWRKVTLARQSVTGGATSHELDRNAFGPFVEGVTTGLVLAISAIVVLAAVSLVRGRELGTLRLALVRGYGRGQLFLANFVALNLFALLFFLVILGASAASASLFFDFGDLQEDGYVFMSSGECMQEIGRALLLALLPTTAAIACAQLVSIASSSSAVAATLALIVNHGLAGVGSAIGGTSRFLYAQYLPFGSGSWLPEAHKVATGMSDITPDDPMNWYLPIPEALLLVCVGLVLMRRRSL